MSMDVEQLRTIAAGWRAARRMFPIYAGISQRFNLGIPPCPELECPIDRSEPEVLDRVAHWLHEADKTIQVWQLRQYLQSTQAGTENALRALIQWLLNKEEKGAADRDKLDFLLVQYFAQCAPGSMHLRQVSLEDVSMVLEPVLGETAPNTPAWLKPLDSALTEIAACQSLGDLLGEGALTRARRLKAESGERYFGAGSMLAFTRYNFVVRRHFIRLIQTDVEAIRARIRDLQSRGVQTVDCTGAGLGADETLERVAQVSASWRKPFHAEYSSGQTFEQLAALRAAVESAIAQPPAKVTKSPEPKSVPAETSTVGASSSHAAAQAGSSNGSAAATTVTSSPVVARRIPATSVLPDTNALEQEIAVEMYGVRRRIRDSLQAANVAKTKASTQIVIDDKTVLLSSWEVAAFFAGTDSFPSAVQRGVAARVLLFGVLEKRRDPGGSLRIAAALTLAHSEAAILQELVAQARDQKDIDAAVALAATSKRLLTLIAEAEK